MMHKQGFSLLETIIAIGVIFTGLVGALSLIIFSLRSSANGVNRVTATGLAMEAVEVAVNTRDSNDLAGDPFDTGLSGDGTAIAVFNPATNLWSFNFAPNTISDPAAQLYLTNGVYIQSTSPSGDPTIFRRMVLLDTSVSGQISVSAIVQWNEGTSVKEVRADRVMYNWRSAIP